ncbi:MAG: hypothetical protein HYU28_07985 [Actinobacteria bacterium]|nr:hypothetical protein [Actinomycetota bacterium]
MGFTWNEDYPFTPPNVDTPAAQLRQLLEEEQRKPIGNYLHLAGPPPPAPERKGFLSRLKGAPENTATAQITIDADAGGAPLYLIALPSGFDTPTVDLLAAAGMALPEGFRQHENFENSVLTPAATEAATVARFAVDAVRALEDRDLSGSWTTTIVEPEVYSPAP